MKKIISILVFVSLMLTSLVAIIPASAEETVTIYPIENSFSQPVDWGTLKYDTYLNGLTNDKFTDYYDLIIDGNDITADHKTDSIERAYVSDTGIELTENSYYVYEFRAKLNKPTGYAGVVIALSGNDHYFMYGGFANDGDYFLDPQGEQRVSDAQISYGCKDNRLKTKFKQGAAIPSYVDEEGYGSWRVIYEGLNIKVQFLNVEGQWEYVNNSRKAYKSSGSQLNSDSWYVSESAVSTLPLPAGSTIAFGIHNREGGRTINIKDAVFYDCTMPADGAGQLADKTELGDYISYVEATFTDESLYETASWSRLQKALTDAKEAYADEALMQNIANARVNALSDAVASLKADMTRLSDLIGECRKLIKANYTSDTWEAFEAALNAAKDNTSNKVEEVLAVYDALLAAKDGLTPVVLDKTELETLVILAGVLNEDDFAADDWADFLKKLEPAKKTLAEATLQSDIDEAASTLKRAIKAINGGELPDMPEDEEPTEVPTDEKHTETPTDDKPTEKPTEKPTAAPTEKPTEAPSEDDGCGGIIGVSAVVVAVVLGAVVLKKKED